MSVSAAPVAPPPLDPVRPRVIQAGSEEAARFAQPGGQAPQAPVTGPPTGQRTPVSTPSPAPSARPSGPALDAQGQHRTSTAQSPAGNSDDLQRIRGIDAEVQAGLSILGVRQFAQIAAWRPDDVARVSKVLGFKGRIEQENWIEQAHILARGQETFYSSRLPQTPPVAADARPAQAPTLSGKPQARRPVPPVAVQSPPTIPAVDRGPMPPTTTAADPVRPLRSGNEMAAAAAAAVATAAASRAASPANPARSNLDPGATGVANAPPSPPAVSDRAAFAGRATVVPPATGQQTLAARLEADHFSTPDRPTLARLSADPPAPSQSATAHRPTGPIIPSTTAAAGPQRPPAISGGRTPLPGPRSFAVVDDLKRIRGIGVLIEQKLNGMGVTGYEQIANWSSADIDRVSEVLDFKGRIERENWVEQARILAAGGQTEFSRRADRNE